MPRAKNPNASTHSVEEQKLLSDRGENPVWFKPVMFGFMLLGLAWILLFYISAGNLPVAALKEWNILVGFGIAFIGFLMTTRWR